MKGIGWKGRTLLAFAMLLAFGAFQNVTAQQAADTDTQAVSQTGLLPVYGVDVTLDNSWVDGTQFPSQSAEFPNSGVSASFQQVWDALKPSGFSAIRFLVDVREPDTSSKRLANLCVWGKANGVKLIPVFIGSDPGQPVPDDYATQCGAFVKALISELKGTDGSHLSDLMQILAYQIERSVNHGGLYGSTPPSPTLLLQAASTVRKAEEEGLKDSGMSATPIQIAADFDYELVRAKAMAGTELTDAAYDQAYQPLKKSLSEFLASANVDLVSLTWLPGSISAGGVDKLTKLLDSIKTDLGTKQLILTTGYSVGFSTPEAQKNYYAVAFTNLADYRAREGGSSPFIGVLYREATTSAAEPTPPNPNLPGEVAKWDLASKAEELSAMWAGTPSAEMDWWLKKVEGGLGILVVKADATGAIAITPQATVSGLATIAGAVSEANTAYAAETSAAATASSGTSDTSTAATTDATAAAGFGTASGSSAMSFKQKVKEGMMGLLDKVFQKLGDKILASGGSGTGVTGESGWGTTGWSSTTSTTDPWATTTTGTSSTGTAESWGTSTTGTSATSTAEASSGTTATSEAPSSETGAASSPASSSGGITIDEVKITPASPHANAQATISVKLGNTGTADASGLDVLITEDSATLIVESDGHQVAKGSSKKVDISWTPTEEKTYDKLAAEIWVGNQQLATSQISPITVSAAPGGVAASPAALAVASATFAPASPKVGQKAKLNISLQNTGGTDASNLDVYLVDRNDPNMPPVALSSGTVSKVAKGASHNLSLDWEPAAEGAYSLRVEVWGSEPAPMAIKEPLDVTVSPAPSEGSGGAGIGGAVGGVKLQDLKAPEIQKPKPIPLDLRIPSGLPLVKDLTVGTSEQMLTAGQVAPISFLLSNPYSQPLSNVKVALMLDGKEIQTRSFNLILPGQSRSVLFDQVAFGSAGKQSLQIALSGGPADELKGSASAMLSIRPSLSARRPEVGVLRRISATGYGRSGSASQIGVRSALPQAFKVGSRMIATAAIVPTVTPVPQFKPTMGTTQGSTTTARATTSLRPITGTGTAAKPTTTTAISGVTQAGGATSTRPAPATTPTIPGIVTPTAGEKPTTVTGTVPSVRPIGTSSTATATATRPTGTATTPVSPTIPGVTSTTTATGAAAQPAGTAITKPTTTTLEKQPTTTIPGVIRPTGTPTAPTTTGTPSTATPTIVKPVEGTRPTAPTTTTTAPTAVKPVEGVTRVTPPAGTATVPTATAPSTSQPTTMTTVTIAPISAPKPDLAVTVRDIRASTASPKPGSDLGFNITVRNISKGNATGAKVMCVLRADGKPLQQREFTVDVKPDGSANVSWSVKTPEARQLALEVSVAHAQDASMANNKAILTVNVAQ